MVERKLVSFELLILTNTPTWDARLTAISDLVFGLSCLAGLVSLTYLGRKLRDLPVHAAFLPFSALLGVTAAGHVAR